MQSLRMNLRCQHQPSVSKSGSSFPMGAAPTLMQSSSQTTSSSPCMASSTASHKTTRKGFTIFDISGEATESGSRSAVGREEPIT
jgi:hypothetical protein